MSQKVLVLDASPIFNILGSGSSERVLDALSGLCVVEEHTLKEVIRNPFDNLPAAATIEKLLARGCLRTTRMGGNAYEQYLELVAANSVDALGRGESAALSYANEVRGIVVLDDRKAKRIGKKRFPSCDQWTSIELFRQARKAGAISKREMAKIVQLAISNARMHVLVEERKWLAELGL